MSVSDWPDEVSPRPWLEEAQAHLELRQYWSERGQELSWARILNNLGWLSWVSGHAKTGSSPSPNVSPSSDWAHVMRGSDQYLSNIIRSYWWYNNIRLGGIHVSLKPPESSDTNSTGAHIPILNRRTNYEDNKRTMVGSAVWVGLYPECSLIYLILTNTQPGHKLWSIRLRTGIIASEFKGRDCTEQWALVKAFCKTELL